MPEDSEIFVFSEEGVGDIETPHGYWKILVVDDDTDVHRATKLALSDFYFMNKGVELLHAETTTDAKQALYKNPDIAVAILDVVMEDDNSGLNLVSFIRDELGNGNVRIVLRTGQPGIAPEKSLIVGYDINGFLEKSELTIQRLYSTMVTCLRTYGHIIALEHANRALKEEYERRLLAEEKMAESDRQAAIGLAVTQIIHGAKNILNALEGGKYIIETALKSDNLKLMKEGWDVTMIGITRMEALTHDLLDLSRFNQLDLKSNSLNRLVDEVVRACENSPVCHSSPDVEVTSVLDPSLRDIRFDYLALHTALLNLVSNAVDTCRDKKHEDDTKGKVVVRTYTEDDAFAVLEVRDNGCGIKPENMANIFKLFFSTKCTKGNGLGLPITKKVVEEHGGTLNVNSEYGKFTMFIIRLPIGT
jgi:signal transduction histidine kinase